MQQFNLEQLHQDLAALDAGDQLTANVSTQIKRLKGMSKGELMKLGTSALMGGNISLEAIGLPANTFEQLETLDRINNVARSKYRAVVTARINELEAIEDAQVVTDE
ncbi:hypothetical protein [Vibrio sp. SCSIO 43137]|uniref:hypothetical protein n=1 Tax=Vibrio sp. SCSIO 43137 TaxID=3021011 RepID=UPI0023078FA8|nr:hypothetical protein [Vibrio sp. SCSIO 43137]WCE30113.1 hypothetical protein PK654_02105 [Vibrio sp. SCSIO 43137]